jgi:hypothetical protein
MVLHFATLVRKHLGKKEQASSEGSFLLAPNSPVLTAERNGRNRAPSLTLCSEDRLWLFLGMR